jgi:hypothetical protein
MPALTDTEIRKRLCTAFEDRTSGGVSWKKVPAEWVRKNLAGLTTQAVDTLIHQHLVNGGKVQQVEETRDEYRHHDFHYDFEILICGKMVYAETVLAEHRMGPVVTIVSVHSPS